VSRESRLLRVCFPDAQAFQREYDANLVNGGVFVASEEQLALREAVRVELSLDFCGESVQLKSEVVHVVTAEMAELGGVPGVAVQFQGQAHEIRAQLEPLARACGTLQYRPRDTGRRVAPRVRARVPAHIETDEEPLEGHTRDLSQSGVLISVSGKGIPVGQCVRLQLEHPTSGEIMEVQGKVVREVENQGGVSALGVEFDPPRDQCAEVERFVGDVQSTEHARRLGGIAGSIAELGPKVLLQMFSKTSRAGTLTLRNGGDEAIVGFEGGLLRYARLGYASGMKALVRMLAWRDGSFDFHAHLDSIQATEAPLPLEEAILEAVRRFEGGARIDRRRYPAEARVSVAGGADALGREARSKVEEAVLDLARAGFEVQRILDVIPEPDPEIYRALASLADCGAITVES
jgi:Tfp pilus assembly protein PilZ